jgi:DNA-binding transcriptional regulator YbjK
MEMTAPRAPQEQMELMGKQYCMAQQTQQAKVLMETFTLTLQQTQSSDLRMLRGHLAFR